MFTFTGTFTDAYGLVHTNPVFVVQDFSSQQSYNTNYYMNVKSGETDQNDNEHLHISYSLVYWPSQAAKDSNNPPLTFIDSEGNSSFNFQPTTTHTTTETLGVIETHFLDEILSKFVVE